MARNSGPGKSRRAPTADCATASSAAVAASVSVREGAEKGSTGRKSTDPQMRVRKLSVAKRVILWMPDSPLLRRAQLSSLPWPSEGTTPSPVTTTIGRPALSVFADIRFSPSARGFHQRQAFTPPMPNPCAHDLRNGAISNACTSRIIARRKQLTLADDRGGERNIHRELRLHPVPQISARGASWTLGLAGQECACLGGRRRGAARTGEDGEGAGLQPLRDALPQFL